MSRRAKIIIAIIIALLLIAIAVFFLTRPQPTTPVVNEPVVNQPVNTNSGGLLNGGGTNFNINVAQPPVNTPVVIPPPANNDRTSLRNAASTFAELFGSFSSEGNYANILDAEYYMTDSVKAWADGYVAEQRALPKTGVFFGVKTNVIFEPEISGLDTQLGVATVLVRTQRLETGSSIADNKVYYQDLTLDFTRVGTDWKVNRFTWGPK